MANPSSVYEMKYLKYKMKYLMLKKQLAGAPGRVLPGVNCPPLNRIECERDNQCKYENNQCKKKDLYKQYMD